MTESSLEGVLRVAESFAAPSVAGASVVVRREDERRTRERRPRRPAIGTTAVPTTKSSITSPVWSAALPTLHGLGRHECSRSATVTPTMPVASSASASSCRRSIASSRAS